MNIKIDTVSLAELEILALACYESSRRRRDGMLFQSDSWQDLDPGDRQAFRRTALRLLREPGQPGSHGQPTEPTEP